MSTDKRFMRRIPQWAKQEETPGIKLNNGPYLGVVKNNFDPTRSGRLQIWIPDLGGDENNSRNWRTVAYASPFFGQTLQTENKNNKFDSVNHTYGFWAVPPDIGNWVLAAFIGGDPGRGFWFACIPQNLGHVMVPGVAASYEISRSEVSADLQSKLGGNPAPVVDFNENKFSAPANWEQFTSLPKPLHEEQYKILVKQGLDRDTRRGLITSSSQRESPSYVFGISTPGRPIEDPAETGGVKNQNDLIKKSRARKGGHTIVLDDGSITTGRDQLVRIRTAGGHQIMMHDNEKTVYISNSEGNTWIELTGDGKILIYGKDSVSIRTEGIFNLQATGNINIQSEADINIRAKNINTESETKNILTKQKYKLTSGKKVDIKSSDTITLNALGEGTWRTGGILWFRAPKIHHNYLDGNTAEEVAEMKLNNLHDAQLSGNGLWEAQPNKIKSIVTIAPSHEPFILHKLLTPDLPKITSTGTKSEQLDPTGLGTSLSSSLPKINSSSLEIPDLPKRPLPTIPDPSDWTKDEAFLQKVNDVAKSLGVKPEDLLTVMSFETGGTFNPAIKNAAGSGATGLIQFMPSTAESLGTSTEELAKMSRAEQMDYVHKYFKTQTPIGNVKNPNIDDLYMGILWPKGVGKPDDYQLFQEGGKAYSQNKGLDIDKSGSVTKAEAAAKARSHASSVMQKLASAGNPLGKFG